MEERKERMVCYISYSLFRIVIIVIIKFTIKGKIIDTLSAFSNLLALREI